MSTLLFIGGLGGWEVLLIVAIVLILFGAKKIPELARGLGTGMREFKNATTEIKKEVEQNDHQEPKQTAPEPASEARKTETENRNKE
ncbi:MAG: twin-arginine translocase TatA/TatE family subunit [Bacteroidota bacterium]